MWLCALGCSRTPSLLRAVLRLGTEPASPDEGSTPDADALASHVYYVCFFVLTYTEIYFLLCAVLRLVTKPSSPIKQLDVRLDQFSMQ